MTKLTPTVICRELIRLLWLHGIRGQELSPGRKIQQIHTELPLLSVELDQSIEWYSSNVLWPVNKALINQIPSTAKVTGGPLELPTGVECGWEQYDCVGVRWIRIRQEAADGSQAPADRSAVDILRFDLRYFV